MELCHTACLAHKVMVGKQKPLIDRKPLIDEASLCCLHRLQAKQSEQNSPTWKALVR